MTETLIVLLIAVQIVVWFVATIALVENEIKSRKLFWQLFIPLMWPIALFVALRNKYKEI